MAKEEKDDFEAVRILVETLTPFGDQEKERIIRWACEKMGVDSPLIKSYVLTQQQSVGNTTKIPISEESIKKVKDIKSFIEEKDPQNDQQLAAVVAYYYAFEASEPKNSIGSFEILEACRLANRHRPKNPIQTLVNTAYYGLLDKTEETGMYRLNAVGENLVAMTLPGGAQVKRNSKKKAISSSKKLVKKPITKKK